MNPTNPNGPTGKTNDGQRATHLENTNNPNPQPTHNAFKPGPPQDKDPLQHPIGSESKPTVLNQDPKFGNLTPDGVHTTDGKNFDPRNPDGARNADGSYRDADGTLHTGGAPDTRRTAAGITRNPDGSYRDEKGVMHNADGAIRR